MSTAAPSASAHLGASQPELLLCPSEIPCGSCGASTALLWEPGPLFSVGSGHCPRCSCPVLSLIGDSIPLEIFIDGLEGLSDRALRARFGLPEASRLLGRPLD